MNMKKILSFVLIAALIVSVSVTFELTASAQSADIDETGANNKLTVICRNQILGEVEVGSEFIYHVALNSGGHNIANGQGELRYDSSYVTIVEHGNTRSDGSVDMNSYSFPTSIRNSNLVTNYLGERNTAYYNFSKYTGIGTFTEDTQFFKIRMKAIKAGVVEIWHSAKCFYSVKNTRLIYNDVSNKQLDPIPYTIRSIEPAAGYVGDANGDWQLNVMDATYLQRISAGEELTYNEVSADANSDGKIDLLDALSILRYQSGKPTKSNIGEWIFASEQ